jgi:hypothetical protein
MLFLKKSKPPIIGAHTV